MEKYIKAMSDVVMDELIYSPTKRWMAVFHELGGVMAVANIDPLISNDQHSKLLSIRSGMLRIFDAITESLEGA